MLPLAPADRVAAGRPLWRVADIVAAVVEVPAAFDGTLTTALTLSEAHNPSALDPNASLPRVQSFLALPSWSAWANSVGGTALQPGASAADVEATVQTWVRAAADGGADGLVQAPDGDTAAGAERYLSTAGLVALTAWLSTTPLAAVVPASTLTEEPKLRPIGVCILLAWSPKGWRERVSDLDELIMLSGGLAFAEPDELKAHDGVQMAEIWLAIRGKVFDVSKAAAFYGPGSGYSLFAGHDATRNLAQMSLSEIDLDEPGYVPADSDEHAALNGWEDKFSEKYHVVGSLQPKAPRLAVLGKALQRLAASLPAAPFAPPFAAAGELPPGDAVAVLMVSGSTISPSCLEAVRGLPPATAGMLRLAELAAVSLDSAIQGVPLEYAGVEAYDFATDAAFQAGLPLVTEKIMNRDGPTADAKLVEAEARAFYFSRCVAPVDVAAYVIWKSTQTAQPLDATPIASVMPSQPQRAQAAATSTLSPQTETAEVRADSEVTHEGKLSFEEVMALVAAGKEVPGCRKVDVQVQDDQQPSESSADPIPKPWAQA